MSHPLCQACGSNANVRVLDIERLGTNGAPLCVACRLVLSEVVRGMARCNGAGYKAYNHQKPIVDDPGHYVPTSPPPLPAQIGVPPYRVRVPTALGRYIYWPEDYDTRQDAEASLRDAGSKLGEVVDKFDNVVTNSEAWWAKQGKDGRP